MFNAIDYINEYENIPDGMEKIKAIKKAIAAADAAGDHEWQFVFRNECIVQSAIHGDAIDAMIIFPQMAAVFDDDPEIQEEHQDDLMWSYKYVLENFTHFYNIDLKQADAIYDDFLKRCRKYGYSERTYRYFVEKRSINTRNYLPAEEYGTFLDYKQDELSDCAACECSFSVAAALASDDEEKAVRLFEPIEKGKLRCAEVPHATYGAWIDYYTEKGRYAEALDYARRLYPMIEGNIDFLNEAGILLTLYSVTDLKSGINIFRKELRNYISSRDHLSQFSFAYGSALLFKKYTESDREDMKKIFIRLPSSFKLYSSDNIYSTEELYDHFYRTAKEISEKFDARNKNTFFNDKLNTLLPEYNCDDSFYSGCYSEYVPSAVCAVCHSEGSVPDNEEIIKRINTVFTVDEYSYEETTGALNIMITDGEEQYRAVIAPEQMTDPSEFRPVHYIDPSVFEEAGSMILTLVMFNDKPDVSYQFQLKLLMTIYPEALALLDFSRRTVLSAEWASIQAGSSVPPLMSYLYNLELVSVPESDKVWITTVGLNCCGLKDIEIFDATKDNYSSYCDMICFAAEGAIIRNGVSSSGEYCFSVRSGNDLSFDLTWLPFTEALKMYSEENWSSSVELRYDNEKTDTMVLFRCDSGKVEPLFSIGDENINELRTGIYIDSEEKTAVYACERLELFGRAAAEYPDNAYVCVSYGPEHSGNFVWLKVQNVSEDTVTGIITEDCQLGQQGDQINVSGEDIINFNISAADFTADPDSAYLI